MKYLLERVEELDSFTSVIMFIAGVVGYTVAPEVIEASHVLVISALSALGILTPDKKSKQ